MILDAEKLLAMEEFKGMGKESLAMKLEAIESLIRSYSNNNFQVRAMRMEAPAVNGELLGHSRYFRVGDTVQVSQSMVNDGLYVVTEITDTAVRVNKSLYDSPLNTVTKVVYPPDVQKGALDMLSWEKDNRKKVGIQSEKLARYSVTYFNQDSNNQVMGYPVSLLGFLRPYMKPRC